KRGMKSVALHKILPSLLSSLFPRYGLVSRDLTSDPMCFFIHSCGDTTPGFEHPERSFTRMGQPTIMVTARRWVGDGVLVDPSHTASMVLLIHHLSILAYNQAPGVAASS
ncbi:11005_t:CDS:2, partial [Acaulospora colombiana]